MTINDFITKNPNHPLAETIGMMQDDCSPEAFAYMQGIAGGIVIMLMWESHITNDDSLAMLAEIGNPMTMTSPITGNQ